MDTACSRPYAAGVLSNPGVAAMARKRVPKVPAIQEEKRQAPGKRTPKVEAIPEDRSAMAVRLELPMEDYLRLEKQARKLGLTKASYARMKVMQGILADEGKA
jgi:hypothetical protein